MAFEKLSAVTVKMFFKRYWYILAGVTLAITAGLGSFLYINYILKPPQPQVTQPQQQNPVDITPKKEESVKKGPVCPLDGSALDELPSRRVLAVSLDNSPEARPQSGLKDADLVIELPAEGGLTRLLAFYYHKDAVRIGPVRSARPYLAAKAQEYGAVLVHVGQSPQTQEYFTKYKTEHINEMPNTPGFWRENNRKPPHNLYTSSMNMWDKLKKDGIAGIKTLQGLKYKDKVELKDAKESPKLTVFYPYGEVVYEYQPIDKDYLRFISGKAHIDAESFLPLRVKNIIIQYVKTRVLDGEGRLTIDLEAQGRAIITTGGRTIEGTWSKERGSVTKYFDSKGDEVLLPPGQTWIEIVQSNMQIDY